MRGILEDKECLKQLNKKGKESVEDFISRKDSYRTEKKSKYGFAEVARKILGYEQEKSVSGKSREVSKPSLHKGAFDLINSRLITNSKRNKG